MSRAATDAFDPHVGGAWTNWNAVISGFNNASSDANVWRVLHMNAVCIWASTWGSDGRVLDSHVFALSNRHMNGLAVDWGQSPYVYVFTPHEWYRLHSHTHCPFTILIFRSSQYSIRSIMQVCTFILNIIILFFLSYYILFLCSLFFQFISCMQQLQLSWHSIYQI